MHDDERRSAMLHLRMKPIGFATRKMFSPARVGDAAVQENFVQDSSVFVQVLRLSAYRPAC